MINTSLRALDAIGYSSKLDLQSQCLIGLLNLAGYIPIIGTVAGLARLKIANERLHSTNHQHNKNFYLALKLRGIIEVFSCGFVFIIPDLLIEIGRSFHQYINLLRISS